MNAVDKARARAFIVLAPATAQCHGGESEEKMKRHQVQEAIKRPPNRRRLICMKALHLTLIFLSTGAITANAWMESAYDWAADVDGSVLIAVGHLKDNSIQDDPHTNAPDAMMAPLVRLFGQSNLPPHVFGVEYHAILVISEVIKGNCTNAEIPIIIQGGWELVIAPPPKPKETNHFIVEYGSKPKVPGNIKPPDGVKEVGATSEHQTNQVRMIYKHPGYGLPEAVVGDASKDNIWFLRFTGGSGGRPGPPEGLGVTGSGDIQPLNRREFFQACFSKSPEEALKAYAAQHPDDAANAQGWLRHLGSAAGGSQRN
jgi:hypothetical protein